MSETRRPMPPWFHRLRKKRQIRSVRGCVAVPDVPPPREYTAFVETWARR